MDSRRRFDSQDGDMMSTLWNMYFQFQPTNWVLCSGSHFSFAIRTLIKGQLETFSKTNVVFFFFLFPVFLFLLETLLLSEKNLYDTFFSSSKAEECFVTLLEREKIRRIHT